MPTSSKPVAYFEATAKSPAPITAKKKITFDAHGSRALSNVGAFKLVPFRKLRFRWKLGDGSKATGPKVKHAYAKKGAYTATLIVTAPGGARDSMKVIVSVQ
jgi:hypothetical protein